MTSGQRRKLITIQQLTESRGTSNFPIEDWTLLRRLLASREDLQAPRRFREDFKGDQLTALTETKWQIPYCADIDPETVAVPKTRRLVYRDRVYDITSATIHEATTGGRYIEFMTVAKVD